jgi:hypothetical protein
MYSLATFNVFAYFKAYEIIFSTFPVVDFLIQGLLCYIVYTLGASEALDEYSVKVSEADGFMVAEIVKRESQDELEQSIRYTNITRNLSEASSDPSQR